MIIAHAIINARAGAERLSQVRAVPFTPRAEVVALVEQQAAIEQLCQWAEENLLKPAPSEDIARAILSEMVPRLDDRLAEAMRTPGQHAKEHGLRAAAKAVRAKS